MLLITAFPDDETRKKARQLGAVAVVGQATGKKIHTAGTESTGNSR